MADELQIAILRVELLHRLSNWGHHVETTTHKVGHHDSGVGRVAGTRKKTKRDFDTVMKEVELEVRRALGRPILAKTLDPRRLQGQRKMGWFVLFVKKRWT
ncbi:hypothetical protein CJ030_MR6G010360 [Morella rubra]|uniref:Uncharacterized protein n=1 Tax=Morella rubra TaxID=262757 RepID=A0A6A1WUB3_9ROSI|nr:hypothetical protein CJ030_MR6G010360 [Morella rubra]